MEMLGGDSVASQCRKPEIMADAAYAILTKSSGFTGNFAIDDKILMEEGVSNFDQYAVAPGMIINHKRHNSNFVHKKLSILKWPEKSRISFNIFRQL